MKKALALFLATLLVFSSFWTGEIVTTKADTGYVVAETFEIGTAYKFGVQQNGVSSKPLIFITGEMSGYYGATTTDATQAVDVYVEEATGGYYLYYLTAESAKKYICIEINETHINLKYNDAPSNVYQYDADNFLFKSTMGETGDCFLGSTGTYQTIGGYKYDTLSSRYPARLYKEGEVQGGGGGETPSEPPVTATPEEIVTALYALEPGAMLSATTKYTLTGVITAINTAWNAD